MITGKNKKGFRGDIGIQIRLDQAHLYGQVLEFSQSSQRLGLMIDFGLCRRAEFLIRRDNLFNPLRSVSDRVCMRVSPLYV